MMGRGERALACATVKVDVGRYICSIRFDDESMYEVYMCADGARAYAENGDRVAAGSFDGDAFCRCVPGCCDRASRRLDVLPEGDAAIAHNVRDLVCGCIGELTLRPTAGRADMVLRVEDGMLAAHADGSDSPSEDHIDLSGKNVADDVVSLLDDKYINREGDKDA